MEKFDVLDCTGRKTGRVISRERAHRTGTWHGAFHCLIVYERAGRGYALFQKRSARKKIAPGRFDVSVGGHYAAGEDAGSAGPREIKEELGLNVDFSELLPLGRRIFVYCFTPGIQEYEFQDVFLLPKQAEPDRMSLQREEVDGLLEMDVETGVALFSGQTAQIQAALFDQDGKKTPATVTRGQFVPCLDNYYLKLLMIAQRCFRGERLLLRI